jgi:acetyltransferase-like isoleucine patch superfamily enzyme
MGKIINLIKNLYMWIYHPFLKFYFFKANNLFIGNRPRIRNVRFLVIGNNVRFGSFLKINTYFIDPKNKPSVKINDNCYIGDNFTILCANNILIEKNVLIASNVLITDENHGIDPTQNYYMYQRLITNKVIIGEGTWVGANVIILPGVSVGKKCVIGAGTVVSKSIPDYSMVVGVPGKVIKKFNFLSKKWEAFNA